MRTKILPVSELTSEQVKQMLEVMDQYYEKITEETFKKDLYEKQKVILLFGNDGKIKGFSTILEQKMTANGRPFVALYSGDTVLQKEYWGNGALATAFGRYLSRVKLSNPFTDVYWFLISKGYKTYLLMSNNFPIHYPRYEKEMPHQYREIMNCFYRKKFGDSYSAQEGLIRFDKSKASSIREYIAEITDELRKNPRVIYFENKNPDWKQGVELACVAKVTLWILIRYLIKRALRIVIGKDKKISAAIQKTY
ncbi:MAG: hypothetical protein ACXVCY_07780 [Pseudobdellovibrionaceae bacterium]